MDREIARVILAPVHGPRVSPSDHLRVEVESLRAASEDPNLALSFERVQLALGAVDALERIGSIEGHEARRWRAEILALEDSAVGPLDQPREFRGDELLRVILVRDERGSEGFEIQAVDLYGDGVGLRWALCGRGEATSAPPNPILTDDVGTRYFRVLDRSSGLPIRGQTFFVPAVPCGATHLLLQDGGRQVSIGL